jgi:hypothetical protein
MARRKKIVRLKEGSACEECPLRENTLYYDKNSKNCHIKRFFFTQLTLRYCSCYLHVFRKIMKVVTGKKNNCLSSNFK